MAHSDVESMEGPTISTQEALIEEVAHLRRTVQDLVALSALPTSWTAPDLPHVAASLADALLCTLRLDFVVVRLKGAPGGGAVEGIRVARSADPPAARVPANPEQAIRQALAPWLDGDSLSLPTAISHLLGSGTVQVAGVPIGHAAELGMLAAGSHRSDFPTETDRLLLRVGANQPAVALARSKAEKALHESEERLRLIAASARCILWEADVVEREDGALAWNLKVWDEEAAQRFLPVRMLEGAGFVSSWYESRLPEDKTKMAVYGSAELRAGGSYRQEFRCRMADGSIRWLAEDVAAEPVASGRWKAVGVCVDITERKRAEQQLRRSEQELADFFDNATLGLHWVGPDGIILRANRAELNLLGYSPDEYVGHHISQFHIGKDVIEDILRRLQAGEQLQEYEARMRCKNGSIRHVLINSSVLWEDGRFIHTRCFTRDITDRKRAMEGIGRQQEDLESLFMQSPVPIGVFKGPDLVYEMANAAYLEVVGGRDILGKPLLQALPEIRGQGFDQLLRGVMRAGEPIVGREALFMLEREGRLQETYWTFICSPLRDTDGAVNRVVALCEDVTEQRRLMHELMEADRRKDEFLATLAHELRNPLAPLRTSVQLLRRQAPPTPSLQRATDVIDRQVQQLVRLVDDLLDVSRITLDKLELRKARVTLAMVVQAAVEASRPLIEQCGHELTVTLPSEPVDLDADLTRLAQVFLNLLNNAARYTERGGRIRLAAEREGNEVVVRVKDTGMGIAADVLPRVFEMFMQADRSLDRAQDGLGLGLTLVKRLVQMHGGSIEARSEGPGQGSEFVVRLPVAIESSPGAHRANGEGAQPAPTSRHRILVVDDNRDAAETLAELLELTGSDLRTAHDGLEAVAVAGEFRPDVVLLDIGLPKLNGYEVARKIREQPWGKGMVLVALTGWGQEQDRHRSREAGFNHHMVKPVDPDDLFKLLTSLNDGRCSAQ
jgi:PAS domain S-box-containing protein